MQLAAERAAYKERKARLNTILSDDTGSNPVNDAQDNVIRHAHELQQANQTTLQNTLRIAHSTNDIANDTQLKLKSQTEQMSRMDVALDDTNASLTRSDRTLRGLKGIGGRISNYFTSPKTHVSKTYTRPHGASASNEVASAVRDKQQHSKMNNTMYGSEYYKDKVSQAQTQLNHNGLNTLLPQSQLNNNNATSIPHGSINGSTTAAQDIAALGLDGRQESKPKKSFFSRRKKVPSPPVEIPRERIEASEKELGAISELKQQAHVEDEQLDELSDVLKQLQMKAQDMNRELNLQNQMVEHIDTQVNGTTSRIKKNNMKIKDILS